MKAHKTKIYSIIRDIQERPAESFENYDKSIFFFQKEMETDTCKLFTASHTTQDVADEIQNYYDPMLKFFEEFSKRI